MMVWANAHVVNDSINNNYMMVWANAQVVNGLSKWQIFDSNFPLFFYKFIF
jgi:hypothetical protein